MIGFGGYRIGTSNPDHEAALRAALQGGITLIDTSTNYGNGQSEQLIGRVLSALPDSKNTTEVNVDVSRNIQVVTKVGYVQGDLHDFAVAQEAMGSPFQDVVKLSDGLWHCIHPDFLASVLDQSCARLLTQNVHAALLHNPEYYLQWAFRESLDVEVSRAELYRRIGLAFEFLEQQVADGRISAYGISSNTFGGDARASDFVSLEQCLEIASELGPDHHFTFVQFPFNLLENDVVLNKNQHNGSRSTLQVARDANMFVMANRPLNAFVDGDLIRLATHPVRGAEAITDIGEFAQEIETTIHALELVEHEVTQDVIRTANVDAEEQPKVHEAFRIANALCSAWNTFQGRMHWEEARRQHLQPRLTQAAAFAPRMADSASLDKYVVSINSMLDQLSLLYTLDENESLDELREGLAEVFSLPTSTPLQHIAIHALNHTHGVNCVLVGMRTPEYVHDVLQCAQLPTSTYDEQTWEKVRKALVELSAEE